MSVELSDVTFRYAAAEADRAVGPLTLSVRTGEHLGVMGPSGCGKSTLLKLVAGLLPTRSEHVLTGVIRNHIAERTLAAQVGFVFQTPALLPQMTVLENVCLPLLALPRRNRDKREAETLLRLVGLDNALHLLPEQLSGGMRTRVAIARALLLHPQLLLMDEPFTGLDIIARDAAYRAIERATSGSTVTIMLVTHDIEEAWSMTNRVVVLNSTGEVKSMITDVRGMNLGDFRDKLLSAMQ